MLFKENEIEQSVAHEAGDIFFAYADAGHIAYLRGEAIILLVESKGSV